MHLKPRLLRKTFKMLQPNRIQANKVWAMPPNYIKSNKAVQQLWASINSAQGQSVNVWNS